MLGKQQTRDERIGFLLQAMKAVSLQGETIIVGNSTLQNALPQDKPVTDDDSPKDPLDITKAGKQNINFNYKYNTNS